MAGWGPDRYGVMGYPVAHSRSPLIHQLFAKQTKQDIRYELLAVRPDDLEAAISGFRKGGGKGLNITVPHKKAVARLADKLSGRAELAGAVNTVSFTDEGMVCDNTDGYGLMRDLRDNLDVEIANKSILILGAGGATRGILAPLLEEDPESVTVANRTVEKAEALARRFGELGPVVACSFDGVPADRSYDLVINATSAGFKGEAPPYPATAIGPDTTAYDLSYGLTPTPFSSWAAEQGAARSIMGWGMLVEQAAESFRIWRGVTPDTKPVLEKLTVTV